MLSYSQKVLSTEAALPTDFASSQILYSYHFEPLQRFYKTRDCCQSVSDETPPCAMFDCT